MSRARALLASALLLAAAPAFAVPDDDSDWTRFVPPEQSTGTATVPTTSEGGFGSPDRTRLDQQLKHGLIDFDQFCRQMQIPIDYRFGDGDFSGSGVGLSRYLRSDADDTVVLVDDQKLHASFIHPFAGALGGAQAFAGLSLGAVIDGHAMVIRRAGTKRSCDEILRLADFRDVKTVFPADAKRISEMSVGELWRVPLTLTYSQGVSVGDANPAGATPVGAAVTVSFGRADNGSASMTLFRISDDKVRFRFRIDHVVVYSKALGLTATYPGALYAADASNILLKFLQQQLAHELAQYTSAWMSYGKSSSDGKKILMEFVVDPRDQAQADALVEAIHGDFKKLAWFSWKMSTHQEGDTMKDYLAMRESNASLLGPSTYAATDEYKAAPDTFAFNFPLFIQHNATTLFGDDRIHRHTNEDGEFHFFRADKSKNSSYLNMPFIGPLVKTNAQRDVEAVTYSPKDGSSGDPIVVYIRNHGYFRMTASSVREPITEINRVLSAAGAQRGADGRRLALPLDALGPPPAPAPMTKNRSQAGEPGDRKGSLSFTLVLNQKAVRDILAAPPQEVLRAFAASLDAADKALMDWLAVNGAVDGKNEIDYDRDAARRAFPRPLTSSRFPLDPAAAIARLSRQAAALLADLAAARGAATNEDRAQALATMIGGKGESGLAYEDCLSVLVRLVDPLDLSGDFVANIQSLSKNVASANNHLVLKKNRPEVPMLKEASDAKARFAQPSILVD